MLSPTLQKAQIYIEQERWDLARQELTRQLADDPNDPLALAWSGLCYLKQDEVKKASAAAEAAIAVAPEWGYGYFILTFVRLRQGRVRDAEKAAREALRTDPEDADYHGLLGNVFLAKGDTRTALAVADAGLKLEPDHEDCLHVRTAALTALGQKDAAAESALYAAQLRPDDDRSHTGMGWVAMRQGKHGEAREHFREALRIDHQNEEAQEGLREALRASFPPYRVVLAYQHFLQRFPPNARWGLFIGLYALMQVNKAVTKSNPSFAPFGYVLGGIYLLFILTTWIAPSLADAALMFHPMGRYALTKPDRVNARAIQVSVATLIVVCVALALLGGGKMLGWAVGWGVVGIALVGLSAITTTPGLKIALSWFCAVFAVGGPLFILLVRIVAGPLPTR